MAKRANSTYTPDNRSKDWLKIKINKRQEVVIGGYTKNEGTAKQATAPLDPQRADQIRSSILSGAYNSLKMADQVARAVIRSGDL